MTTGSEGVASLLARWPPGRRVEIVDHAGNVWTGTLVPTPASSASGIVQLKLDSGYNVGVRLGPQSRARLLDAGATENGTPVAGASEPSGASRRSGESWVALLTTGGTIGSRVDYRTGGVRPVKEEREILEFYPDLSRDGPVRVIPVLDRLSEEIAPADWATLAERVVQTFHEGATGIVIAHGTDTLAYTAAALSFLVRDPPGPIVLVGAQRSPDRPSSDGFTNLPGAVRVARSAGLAEVVVVMHAGLSDDRLAIHRGTRVRKMHASRRDAFRSRNEPPLGEIVGDEVRLSSGFRVASGRPCRFDGPLGSEGALLWFYPGLSPHNAETFARGRRGVILAGTGLGHVSTDHLPWIRAAIADGAVVGMTTQCLEGTVDPNVYATGRDLEAAGVLYLGDLLPETAYVKLLWALGHAATAAETSRLLATEIAGELSTRRTLTEPP